MQSNTYNISAFARGYLHITREHANIKTLPYFRYTRLLLTLGFRTAEVHFFIIAQENLSPEYVQQREAKSRNKVGRF